MMYRARLNRFGTRNRTRPSRTCSHLPHYHHPLTATSTITTPIALSTRQMSLKGALKTHNAGMQGKDAVYKGIISRTWCIGA